jgi:hypothetical protein
MISRLATTNIAVFTYWHEYDDEGRALRIRQCAYQVRMRGTALQVLWCGAIQHCHSYMHYWQQDPSWSRVNLHAFIVNDAATQAKRANKL